MQSSDDVFDFIGSRSSYRSTAERPVNPPGAGEVDIFIKLRLHIMGRATISQAPQEARRVWPRQCGYRQARNRWRPPPQSDRRSGRDGFRQIRAIAPARRHTPTSGKKSDPGLRHGNGRALGHDAVRCMCRKANAASHHHAVHDRDHRLRIPRDQHVQMVFGRPEFLREQDLWTSPRRRARGYRRPRTAPARRRRRAAPRRLRGPPPTTAGTPSS